MILVDANLLVYAINEDAPLHRKARSWLEFALSGSVVLGALLFAIFKAISFVFATTNSFFWNKYWTIILAILVGLITAFFFIPSLIQFFSETD